MTTTTSIPIAVRTTSTPITLASSSSVSNTYRNPFDYQRFNYSYPYQYGYGFNQPNFHGTCSSVSGVGVTSNQCAPGSVPISSSNNGCYCYNPRTGSAGCGITAGAVCRAPVAAPIVPASPWYNNQFYNSYPYQYPQYLYPSRFY